MLSTREILSLIRESAPQYDVYTREEILLGFAQAVLREAQKLRPMHTAPKDGAVVLVKFIGSDVLHAASWSLGGWDVTGWRETVFDCELQGWLPHPDVT